MAMNSKKSPESFLMKLALGAALAASAGYAYFSHKEEIDAEAKKRIEQLAEIFSQSKKEVEKRAKQVWGEANKEAIAKYLDIRAHLLHALENEEWHQKGKIVKQRYDALVDMVVKKARTAGFLQMEDEKNLASVLKADWNLIEKTMIGHADKLQQKVSRFIKAKTNPSLLQKGQNKVKNYLKKRAVQKSLKKGKKVVGKLLKKNIKKTMPVQNKAKKIIKNVKKIEKKAAQGMKKTIKKIRK